MRPISNFDARDIESIIHPMTNLVTHRTAGPLVLDRAEGVFVYDQRGKRYLEGLAGLWCTALGYGNQELVETAREQMSKLSFTHLFGGRSHEPAIALAEKIREIAPCPTSKVFFTSSGSEANDSQIKLAWYANNGRGKPKKKKIISRMRAYHGTTIASASLTGLPIYHADFDLPIAGILHTDCPHHWKFGQPGESEEDFASRCAASLEALILQEGPDTVAAFIAEPVMGAGGVIVPPRTYFPKMQAVLSKYDIAFIADEVICGFGRTGNRWGSETLDAHPTTVSMAKAITSAYVPLGAITVPEETYEALMEESKKQGIFAHGFTYSGHPLACAVALKTLEIYERIDLVGHVRRVSPRFQARLKTLGDHPLVGEARGLGLIGALELAKNKSTKTLFEPKQGVGAKVSMFAQEEGLIVRAVAGDSVCVCPPLVIKEGEIDLLFDMLGKALDKAHEWARREGHIA
jgi:4-aminobutyrate--pyruvate transaminase